MGGVYKENAGQTNIKETVVSVFGFQRPKNPRKSLFSTDEKNNEEKRDEWVSALGGGAP